MRGSIVLPVLVAALGCGVAHPLASDESHESRESVRATAQAIINGQPSPASENAVVVVRVLEADGTGGDCSGTLIGHRVVITARHCVSAVNDDFAITSNVPLSALSILVGTQRPGDTAPPTALVKQVLAPQTTTTVNADIALLVLDRAVPGTVAPIRLVGGAQLGEDITFVGWGLTELGVVPTVRLRRPGAKVLGVGSDGSAKLVDVGTFEFLLGEGTCFGDSGGPSFSSKTMAVVGLVSRGGNGRASDFNACIGADVEDVHTNVASYRSLIEQAFAVAGETPTLEGAAAAPAPAASTATPAKSGAAASGDDDDDTTKTTKTKPKAQPQIADQGCSSSRGRATDASWTTSGLLLAAAVLRSRRRRASLESPQV